MRGQTNFVIKQSS